MKEYTTQPTLLRRAKKYVSECEKAGEDWQGAVFDINNSAEYAPLFDGLSEYERDELLKEISLGE